jgi:hypothetical protein
MRTRVFLVVLAATLAAFQAVSTASAARRDRQAPTVSLTSPAAQATLSGTVSLTASASDNVSVSRVDFYAGTAKVGSDTAAPYQASWSTTSVASGSYQLKATAVDSSGNQTSSSVPVTVSNAVATPVPNPPVSTPTALLSDGFDNPISHNLITNEFTYWNPGYPGTVVSPVWEMTSGSFFSSGGYGWSGVPDACDPDIYSQNCTNSAVFRLTSKQANFGNVAVNVKLRVNGLSSTSSTPPVDWDGIHLFLRYQSETSLYYASVARRDGRIVIKKKCTGGSSNGGTYYELGSEIPGHAIPTGSWVDVGASIATNAGGTVTIRLYRGGALLDQATDTGVGCAPITAPGKVGVRGDNADFNLVDFTVTAAS